MVEIAKNETAIRYFEKDAQLSGNNEVEINLTGQLTQLVKYGNLRITAIVGGHTQP